MRDLTQEEINKILSTLNSGGITGWVDSGLNVGLPTVNLGGERPNVSFGQTVIVRMFINTVSGDSRFFVIRAITGETE